MPRRPGVRFFDSRNAYYTQRKKKQHRLADGPDDFPDGPNYTAAVKKYLEILHDESVSVAPERVFMATLIQRYLAHLKRDRKKNTHLTRKLFLESFDARFPKVMVCELKPHHAHDWANEGRDNGWSAGTARIALTSVTACLSWAEEEKIIPQHPLKGLRRPPAHSRSREALIDVSTHRRALAVSNQAFQKLLIALEATGARPGEIAAATAEAWDDSAGAFVYYSERTARAGEHLHKTSSKDKPRMIFFAGEALQLVRQLVLQHPSGPIFRNSQGRRWTLSAWGGCSQRVKRVLGLTHFNLHGYRHTFATNWLKSGRSIDVLADLLGNSANVLREHYSHLLADTANIRARLEGFRADLSRPGKDDDEDVRPDFKVVG